MPSATAPTAIMVQVTLEAADLGLVLHLWGGRLARKLEKDRRRGRLRHGEKKAAGGGACATGDENSPPGGGSHNRCDR